MSQKDESEINIDAIFNFAQFSLYYPADQREEYLKDEKKKKWEDGIYHEVINGLKNDIEQAGLELTYSARIIIGKIAMNIVMLNRIKYQFVGRGLLRDKMSLKPEQIIKKHPDSYPRTTSSTIYYDTFMTYDAEEVHPIFDKLIPKLYKQIDDGLKQLGLLPIQQIERQKLTIVKKLKRKYEDLEAEYSVKAESNGKITKSNKKSIITEKIKSS